MLAHMHAHTVAHIHNTHAQKAKLLMLSDVRAGVPVWIRIHFCLPFPLNQYPPSVDRQL